MGVWVGEWVVRKGMVQPDMRKDLGAENIMTFNTRKPCLGLWARGEKCKVKDNEA